MYFIDKYLSELLSVFVGSFSTLVLFIYTCLLLTRVSKHKIKYTQTLKSYLYILVAVIAVELTMISSDSFNNVELWFSFLQKFPAEHVKYWLILALNVLLIDHLKTQYK